MRKKIKQGSAVFLFIIILLGISGCGLEQKAWEDAKKADSHKAYLSFLKNYPNSKYMAEVEHRLAEIRSLWHPSLIKVKTVKFKTSQNYQRAGSLRLNLAEILEEIPRGLGLKILGSVEEEADLLIVISLSGQALSKGYSPRGMGVGSIRYAGARTWGSISLKIEGKIVVSKTFAGRLDAPNRISSKDRRKKPAQAPYRKTLYLKNSFVQKYYEAMGSGFGYPVLNLSLLSRKREISTCAADALINLIKIRGNRSLEIFSRMAADAEFRTRLVGIKGMGTLKTSKAAEALLELPAYRNRNLRRTVVAQLGNFRGDKITERLSMILGNDEDSSIRRWAAEIIGRSKAEKGFKPLLKALDDKNFQVRKVAIQYLGNYNNEELIDRLIVALQEDKAGSIRRRAAELLGKSMNKKVITALVAALQDKSIMVRMEAAWALGEIGNFKAVAPLLNNLSRGNPIGRKKSFKALGKIKDERAIPILIIFLRSSRIKWLKTTINNALKKISGQKFKADWKAWNSWWEKKKKTALSKKKLARG